MPEAKLSDIQLNKAGTFTLFFVDVASFNKVLNDLATTLQSKGHPHAKTFVPRSIQRIKDTERIAFVKRVDLDIPDARIKQALLDVGLQATNVDRLLSREGKTATRTVKITFEDATNRNTFVRCGLQIDSMHFNAEAASQNTKPVQCFVCMKYNHVAKYCKTKQQTCLRCGENHRAEQCTVTDDQIKCCNCKGKHVATSTECSFYQEQEKRARKLVNQYATPHNNTTTSSPPSITSNKDFPPLPSAMRTDAFNEIINVLTSRMEKIIEETTQRIVNTFQKKIDKLEKALARFQNKEENLTASDSESSEECEVLKHIHKNKQEKEATAKATASTTQKTTTTSKTKSKKQQQQASKRARSPNTSFDSSTVTTKDLKTSNNDD
jgi:hypothetical protein